MYGAPFFCKHCLLFVFYHKDGELFRYFKSDCQEQSHSTRRRRFGPSNIWLQMSRWMLYWFVTQQWCGDDEWISTDTDLIAQEQVYCKRSLAWVRHPGLTEEGLVANANNSKIYSTIAAVIYKTHKKHICLPFDGNTPLSWNAGVDEVVYKPCIHIFSRFYGLHWKPSF